MNPRVDVTIIDHYGSYSDLRDEYGNPIEIYINDEMVYTEGQVGRLEQENEKLRELVRELYEDAFLEYPSHFDKTYMSRLAELGIEVDRECMLESEET